MSEIDLEDEFHKDRCGRFTGSCFNDVIAVKKDGKPTQKRQDLIWSIAAERIQGYQPKGPNSYSLQWGKDNEKLAIESYEIRSGEFVTKSKFIVHPKYDYAGVSPDGLVNEDGGVEAKCPKSPEIHLQRFIEGVPVEYMPQIQGGMWVTGRKWWDFISYDPDTDPKFKLLIIRVNRDEEYIKNLEHQILTAELEVQELVNQLLKKVA